MRKTIKAALVLSVAVIVISIFGNVHAYNPENTIDDPPYEQGDYGCYRSSAENSSPGWRGYMDSERVKNAIALVSATSSGSTVCIDVTGWNYDELWAMVLGSPTIAFGNIYADTSEIITNDDISYTPSYDHARELPAASCFQWYADNGWTEEEIALMKNCDEFTLIGITGVDFQCPLHDIIRGFTEQGYASVVLYEPGGYYIVDPMGQCLGHVRDGGRTWEMSIFARSHEAFAFGIVDGIFDDLATPDQCCGMHFGDFDRVMQQIETNRNAQ
ncbi:MAG: hypothetical protein FWC93_05965 [Defluviitaleaceae bacterium]|nr:hypothetical protein [Defluviitaleaceae bacterium]